MMRSRRSANLALVISSPKAAAVLLNFALLAAIMGCGSGVTSLTAPTLPPVADPPLASQCKSTVPRPSGPVASSNFAGPAISGRVLAGNLPIIGAGVQIYAAGTTGNGSAPSALGGVVMTDAHGAFSLSAAYTCPYDLSVLYAVARGGKVGASGASNSGTVLLAVLGTCKSVSAGTTFIVDEATTVAGAYALAQFLAPGASVGGTPTNLAGLALAAAGAANIVDPIGGQAPGAGFPAGGTAPSLLVNALANALNACIVSSASSSMACTQMYAAATVGSVAPSNTLDAALNIARHPSSNVAAIFSLSALSGVYAPALSAAPSDWTMFATYSGGGMSAPSGLGVDSAGNIRVANYFDVASYFSNTGTATFPTGITGNNLHESYGLAIDQKDNVWIPVEQTSSAINGRNGTMVVFNRAGQSVSGATGFSQGGLNFPVAVAIDPSGTSWVVDYGNSHLTLMDASGNPLSGTAGYATDQFVFPVAVAVDSRCYGFVANQSGTTVTRVAPDGSSFKSFVTGAGPSGVAVDSADNVWVANYYGSSVNLLSAAGTVLSAGFTGGGMDHPQGIAVDGAGNLWVSSYRGSSITELAGASASVPGTVLSPVTGFGKDAALIEAFALAIDAAGNIWVTNFGNNTLTEFVGLAAPVRTPLLGAVAQP